MYNYIVILRDFGLAVVVCSHTVRNVLNILFFFLDTQSNTKLRLSVLVIVCKTMIKPIETDDDMSVSSVFMVNDHLNLTNWLTVLFANEKKNEENN